MAAQWEPARPLARLEMAAAAAAAAATFGAERVSQLFDIGLGLGPPLIERQPLAGAANLAA